MILEGGACCFCYDRNEHWNYCISISIVSSVIVLIQSCRSVTYVCLWT